jgi:hypothetical protein
MGVDLPNHPVDYFYHFPDGAINSVVHVSSLQAIYQILTASSAWPLLLWAPGDSLLVATASKDKMGRA